MSTAAKPHLFSTDVSPWVMRFAALIAPGGEVLDLACGGGRHARWLAQQGFAVDAVDRDAAALATLAGVAGIRPRCAELEDGQWPFADERYDAVVVTNYLFRPRFDEVLKLVGDGGVLIYETFMVGNERFGKPGNPAFLLQTGELLQRLDGNWTIVAFEQGEVASPRAAVVQRVCALKTRAATPRLP